MFTAYLRFLWQSTNEHGVHSPFVFNLVSNCFYDSKQYRDSTIINSYRKQLLANNTVINIQDFGAGSRVFKGNERIVSKMAKTVGIKPKRARLLNRLAKYFNIKNALELGTSLGIATCSLALGSKQVTTIEGCASTAKIAQKQFENFNLKNINLIIGNFDDELKKLTTQYDLIYIDGNHQRDATLRYFELVLKNSHNDTIFIFDDIHWSKGMEEAWNIICNDKRVRVSIDTFQWGIVSLRKEQEKEHFVIRV